VKRISTRQPSFPQATPRWATSIATLALSASCLLAGPTLSTWPVSGPDDSAAVAASALSGWYAVADTFEDSIELRDIDQTLKRTITKAEIQSLLPWMSLDGGQDGVHAMAFSDSGRLLFIGVHDNVPAPDAGANDGILRYDTITNQLSLFAREDFTDIADWPHASMAHFKGKLYVGALSGVRIYRAQVNDTTGTILGGTATPGGSGQFVTGLAIDRETSTLYASWALSSGNSTIARSPLTSNSLTFTTVGSTIPNIRALAWSDHYGGPANAGLYILSGTSSSHTLSFITPTQARGTATFAPSTYQTGPENWHDLASTADGALLIGSDEDAVLIRDTADTRLPFRPALANEFAQVIVYAKGLISPDGEPAGWVIDADTISSRPRFHPATPDAAGFCVMLLCVNDQLNNDPASQTLVRTILQRYAGQAPDGIKPSRTADGIFKHWIDPLTGNTKPGGWDAEYATLSTMLIVQGAATAAKQYPADAAIQSAAREIICNVKNWDNYIRPSDSAIAFKGLFAGGPDTTSWAKGFHEGMLFVRQASVYGGLISQNAYLFWLDRFWFPTATFITGLPVTSNVFNNHLPQFITAYCQFTLPEFRASSTWQTHARNLRASHAAWTDDNGPQYNTVFSAGTNSFAGGYNADSLSNHPGDMTTFPSLMSTIVNPGATLRTEDAVAAYQAYRRGARANFRTGATFLWRRSNTVRTNNPDSAGMVDVAPGALGLAELLSPGIVANILAVPMPSCIAPPECPADFDNSGGTPDAGDVDAFFAAWLAGDASADFDSSGGTPDAGDVDEFFIRWLAGC
jgi:hypothetical protein